ncbi:choice-of-anchor Q domain-containing protein, partial [Thiolapillus sp.]
AQTIGSRSIRVTCSEEPDAGNPHVRFCEGESQQWPIYSTTNPSFLTGDDPIGNEHKKKPGLRPRLMKSHEENKMKSRVVIAGALAFANPASAITVHQVKRMADHGPHTLRAAIATAASGDRITFAPWLYGKTIRLDSQITINKNLRIEGDIDGDRRPDITLDGQEKHRILNVTSGSTVRLWGLTLTHGSAPEGGAIYNLGNITAQYCRISDNQASDTGGAIYNRGNITIDSSTMADNVAQQGGAIFTDKRSATDPAGTMLIRSTFTGNRAYSQGGVVYNYHGTFRAYSSTFGGNLAHGHHDWSYSTNAKGSVLYQFGGGDLGGVAEFTDSTLKNNRSAPLRDPELRECDVAERNSSCSNKPDADRRRNNRDRRVNNGGTIYHRGVSTNRQDIKLTRTVIANSTGRNCGGWGWFSLDHAWSDDNTCDGDVDYDGPGVSRGDSKLGPLTDNGGYTLTFKPLADSGLIDEGGSVCAVGDQRGAHRTSYGDEHCDIGAVEVDATAPSRLRAQPINTTPPDEHNENPATLHQIIDGKNAEIATKNETITAQQADIDGKAETIANKQAEIEDKDDTITSQQTAIAEKSETITTQQAALAAKSETIADLQMQLQTINGRLEELRYRISKKDGNLAQLEEQARQLADRAAELEIQISEHQARIAELEIQISEHQARIAELEKPDDLELAMGAAVEINSLTLNGKNALHDSATRVKIGGETLYLADTLTVPAHTLTDGSTVSSGQIQGENGIIYWTTKSIIVPRTNFHVTRWEFSSDSAFGNVALSVYLDLDIGQYPHHNGLIVGGTGHPNRLLITDLPDPSEGVAMDLRSLKNASRMGWVGSPDIYHGRRGEILDPSILTGAYAGWGQYTPDQNRYPGSHGYGPADIAVAMGVMLKPSAKLAGFETTIVGAPNGSIE